LTATGVRPRIGIIAVDPAVIPLHSLLYVPGYGYGWAEDTGKLIKGNSVDLFMKTKGTAFKWGRKPVTVIIFLQKKRGAKGAA
jgi:3D (Asp-Asp-Asp) domain-containing protein